ncbi:MAG: hypothetical protein SV062_11335 [Thermodesulfobacteriota bacterium]|nr:hypothetical protein [Thermodesulfobacteriota bacterium]
MKRPSSPDAITFVDPFYLTWKAREYDFPARFIELAGGIKNYIPYYVVEKVVDTSSYASLIVDTRGIIYNINNKKVVKA